MPLPISSPPQFPGHRLPDSTGCLDAVGLIARASGRNDRCGGSRPQRVATIELQAHPQAAASSGAIPSGVSRNHRPDECRQDASSGHPGSLAVHRSGLTASFGMACFGEVEGSVTRKARFDVPKCCPIRSLSALFFLQHPLRNLL